MATAPVSVGSYLAAHLSDDTGRIAYVNSRLAQDDGGTAYLDECKKQAEGLEKLNDVLEKTKEGDELEDEIADVQARKRRRKEQGLADKELDKKATVEAKDARELIDVEQLASGSKPDEIDLSSTSPLGEFLGLDAAKARELADIEHALEDLGDAADDTGDASLRALLVKTGVEVLAANAARDGAPTAQLSGSLPHVLIEAYDSTPAARRALLEERRDALLESSAPGAERVCPCCGQGVVGAAEAKNHLLRSSRSCWSALVLAHLPPESLHYCPGADPGGCGDAACARRAGAVPRWPFTRKTNLTQHSTNPNNTAQAKPAAKTVQARAGYAASSEPTRVSQHAERFAALTVGLRQSLADTLEAAAKKQAQAKAAAKCDLTQHLDTPRYYCEGGAAEDVDPTTLEQQRKDVRRERNRQHARVSRERKRQKLEHLQEENDALRRQEAALMDQRDRINARLLRVEYENRALRAWIQNHAGDGAPPPPPAADDDEASRPVPDH